jgi:predicted RNA-binding Zn-ribbon protein involved in translation (DUF1610 family)
MAGKSNWLRWCPKGCGKKVMLHVKKCRHTKEASTYKCLTCGGVFVKEELLK